jgi:transposase-like protein
MKLQLPADSEILAGKRATDNSFFFAYPPEIRKVIYTTNAIESLNMSLRKVTKAKRAFPHDEVVFKIFWLALQSISKKWTMPVKDWKAALNQFAIQFEDRGFRLNRKTDYTNL